MASLLPAGWCDSGQIGTFALSGSVELNASGNNSFVFLGLRGSLATGTAWKVFEVYHQVGPDNISDLYVWSPLGVSGANIFPPFPVLIDSINHGPSAPPANTFFAPVSFLTTIGPLRLGARFDTAVTTGPTEAPQGLADTNVLRHAWFEDENAFFDEAVGGETENVPCAPFPRLLTGSVSTFTCTGGPSPPGVGVPIAKFTNVMIGPDQLDTDGIDDSPTLFPEYSQVALGAFNINDAPSPFFLEAAPGVEVIFANDFLDYSGAAATPDITDNWLTQVDLFRAVPKTPQQPFVTNGPYIAPFTTSYDRTTKDPPGSINLAIDTGWLLGNGYDPSDLTVVLDQHSPLTGIQTYIPVLLAQQGAIEIDHPAAGRPSSWVINSGANGSVTENVGDTVFGVTNTAARFTRDYATNWRAYTTGPHASPEWVVDGYTFLRRHYGIDFRGVAQGVYPEDYWWWNSYMFLRLSITATASATMTLLVSGIDLQPHDTHHPNAGTRAAGLMFGQFTDTRTYRVPVTNGGPTDYWIDLSFPDGYVSPSGAIFPMRRPRVERLELSFDTVGTYTVDAWELSRRDPAGYATEVKVSYAPQSTYNAEWPGVYLRVDGEATPILTYGDALQKGMEAEIGGSIRWAEPEAGSVSQARAMWEQLQRIEGFTVTYDDTQRSAFMQDAFGVNLVTQAREPAQFAREVAPGDVFVGAGDSHSYSPGFSIRVGAVTFPNGLTMTVRGRHVFGGGVEAVAMENGDRAGAGLNFDLLDQANATLASVVSDTRGRIHFEPIGHNKIVRFVPA